MSKASRTRRTVTGRSCHRQNTHWPPGNALDRTQPQIARVPWIETPARDANPEPIGREWSPAMRGRERRSGPPCVGSPFSALQRRPSGFAWPSPVAFSLGRRRGGSRRGVSLWVPAYASWPPALGSDARRSPASARRSVSTAHRQRPVKTKRGGAAAELMTPRRNGQACNGVPLRFLWPSLSSIITFSASMPKA